VENQANILRFSRTLRGRLCLRGVGRFRGPDSASTRMQECDHASSSFDLLVREQGKYTKLDVQQILLSDEPDGVRLHKVNRVLVDRLFDRSLPAIVAQPGSGGSDPGLGPCLRNLRRPGAGVAPSRARPRHSRSVGPAPVDCAQAARRERGRRGSWL